MVDVGMESTAAVLDPIVEIDDPEARTIAPDIDHLVTEDDTPVDNFASEKQQRLLVEPLYAGWRAPRRFIAAANVGVFSSVNRPPLVPDMFLSLGVTVPEDWWAKAHRTYFLWEFGKPPDVAIEIVSNKKGGETRRKLKEYARMGVPYYVVYDPQRLIQATPLQAYELRGPGYAPMPDARFGPIGLMLVLWEGDFEARRDQWLRWADLKGRPIPTGAEQAEREHRRAERQKGRAEREHARAVEERRRADEETRRADDERRRADQAQAYARELADQLRALGIEPGEAGQDSAAS